MRLVTFSHQGKIRIGAINNNRITELSSLVPVGEPWNLIPLLEQGEDGLAKASEMVAATRQTFALKEVELLAPILRPGKYLALGLNYKKHAEEAHRKGIEKPKRQVWFNKQITCINGPYSPIQKPKVSDKLDYEAELGFVIARRCKHVQAAKAADVIGGYLVCNDLSVRDWQHHSSTWTMGKSFDTHGPIGPWLVTADEIEDPHALNIRSLVNGEIRQDANTAEMTYSCYEMIEYLTAAFTLEPGDVIATGTPAGIGAAMDPPQFLKADDVVRCEIEGIGAIENKVVLEDGA